DRFLRALVLAQQPSAPLVVRLLREPALDDALFVRAVTGAWSCLGFEVSPLGGRAKPDLVSVARLGYRPDKSDLGTSDYAVLCYCGTTRNWLNLERVVKGSQLDANL